MALYVASYLFLLKLRLNNPALPPITATPFTLVAYWRAYGTDPYTRQWLGYCLAGGVGVTGTAAILALKPKERSLHGDARFATRIEVWLLGLFGNSGIIIGRWGRRLLVLGRQLAAMVIAPPRSGKGVAFVQPNALSWRGSIVVNDMRKECYRITAGFRSLFSEVHLFNPLAPDGKTAQFNPLSSLYIPDEPAQRVSGLQRLANMLSPNPAQGDEFWPASCRDLFLGLGLYVIETPELPRTIGEVVRQIMLGVEGAIGDHLRDKIAARDAAGRPLSTHCKMMLYDFIELPPQTQSSIRKTFTSKLQLWTNPLVDAATSGDSFDLRMLRSQRLSIYFGVDPRDQDYLALLINLFFTHVLHLNMDRMPEDDQYKHRDDPTRIRHEALVILDEFAGMGRMPLIEKTIQAVGGYGIRLLFIAHSVSQLQAIYGKDSAAHIIKCCGAQIVYAPADPDEAAKISTNLGTFTVKNTSRSRPAGLSGKAGSESTSQAARKLLTPQEVRMLGPHKQIIWVEHAEPILCNKVVYYADRQFAPRANLALPEIKPVAITMPPAMPPHPKHGEGGRARPTRSIKPKDVPHLGRLGLTDFAVNFDHIQIPKGESLTASDVDNVFNQMISSIK
jgi:type IV secretion system protein VirD4